MPKERILTSAFTLTPAERKILYWLSRGQTRQDIVHGACGKCYSDSYIKRAIGVILEKLAVENIEAAIKIGRERGII